MSKRSLSSSEESIIALGFNFVPAPTSISEKTIIAETEAVADKDAAKLRNSSTELFDQSQTA